MSVTHEAYLNIVPGDSPAPIIKVSQYDADFSIVFHLIAKKRGVVPAYPRTVENDEDVAINVPTSATVSVRGTKTDGNGYSANATLSGTATAPIVTVAGHEQMTASAGVNVYEITFYADNATKRLSTANFILFVEPAALDASTITSESLMLELNDLIASVQNAIAAADRAEAAAAQFEIDTTLTQQGKPADAKKVGDEINDIKADLTQIFSTDAKTALLACFAKVAWIDEHGQDYYDALEAALNGEEPEPQPPQPVEYVWDWTSGELPEGMTADSYTKRTDLEGMLITTPNMSFGDFGDMQVEIVCKAYVWGNTRDYGNSPQIVISTGEGKGIKLVAEYGDTTSNPGHAYAVAVDGTTKVLTGMDCNVMRTIIMKAQNGTYSLNIDGTDIELQTPSGTSQYFDWTGISSARFQDNRTARMVLRSLKFKAL